MKTQRDGDGCARGTKESATEIVVFCLLGLALSVVFPCAFAEAVSVSVFLNPPQDGGVCAISDFGYPQQEAEDFQLTGTYLTVTTVQWWGAYGSSPDPAAADDYVIRFFSDDAGEPNIYPFEDIQVSDVTRTATGMTASTWFSHDGGTIYEYSADLPSPITFTEATTYYLSVVNNTDSIWGWAENGSPSHWYRPSDAIAWSYSGQGTNLAFELYAIPEPATLLLFGLGAVMLRRKQ